MTKKVNPAALAGAYRGTVKTAGSVFNFPNRPAGVIAQGGQGRTRIMDDAAEEDDLKLSDFEPQGFLQNVGVSASNFKQRSVGIEVILYTNGPSIEDSAQFKITATSLGGQPFSIGGERSSTFSLTIGGRCELEKFLACMADIYKRLHSCSGRPAVMPLPHRSLS